MDKQQLDYTKIKELPKRKTEAQQKRNGMLEKNSCWEIVENLKKKKGIADTETAFALITGLAQTGGSNKNAGPNTSYEIGGFSLNANEFANIIGQTVKGGTIRQFCRTMADEIAMTAQAIEENGDLAKQMILEHPELNNDDAVWCSNFQTKNPSCPKKVRDWLIQNYNKRFKN